MNNLQLNALDIELVEKDVTVYLSDKQTEDSIKFSKNEKEEISKTFGVDSDELLAHLMRTGEEQIEIRRAIAASYCNGDDERYWSVKFMKSYYSKLLLDHFRELGLPCSRVFVGDIEVWVEDVSPYKNCTGYKAFSLKVQFDRGINRFELLVAYRGVKSVSNFSVSSSAFSHSSDSIFATVVYKNRVERYKYIDDEIKRNLSETFPLLNGEIKSVMGLGHLPPERGNRYIKYKEQIEDFKATYLMDERLLKKIEIASEWKQKAYKTYDTTGIKDMRFGNGVDTNAMKIKWLGPLELIDGEIEFFFIGHKSTMPFASAVHRYLEGEASSPIDSFQQFTKTRYSTSKKGSIWFESNDTLIDEVEMALKKKLEEQTDDGIDKQYMAIFLSPYSKYSSNSTNRNVYYEMKEMLLNYNIVSQVLEVDKFWKSRQVKKISLSDDRYLSVAELDKNFEYSLANISTAMMAKMGGKPWGIDGAVGKELVVGVSAYKQRNWEKPYAGSAFVFGNDGGFNRFECFESNKARELAGSIKLALWEAVEEQKDIDRLIVHFYKQLSYNDLKPIQDALQELNLSIPVIFVTINKTYSADEIGFDTGVSHLMPATGVYLQLDEDKYLMYNNQLWLGGNDKVSDKLGYPFPLKLTVVKYEPNSREKKLVSESEVEDIMKQICKFSLLYWKSVSPQYMPVTLAYPEMLAKIAPNFKYKDWGKLGGESLWFL